MYHKRDGNGDRPLLGQPSIARATFLKCPRLPPIFDGVLLSSAPVCLPACLPACLRPLLKGKRYCHLSVSRSRMVRMPLRKLRERGEREKGRDAAAGMAGTLLLSPNSIKLVHPAFPLCGHGQGRGGRGGLDPGRTSWRRRRRNC